MSNALRVPEGPVWLLQCPTLHMPCSWRQPMPQTKLQGTHSKQPYLHLMHSSRLVSQLRQHERRVAGGKHRAVQARRAAAAPPPEPRCGLE